MNELIPPYQLRRIMYTVMNPDDPLEHREVWTPLSEQDIEIVAKDGYVVLREYVKPKAVHDLERIVDEQSAKKYGASTADTYSSGRFGGQFIRDLHDDSVAAWELLIESGIPDLVRSLLGPRIVLRSYSARITHPGSESSTVWHCDQRARSTPRAPWLTDAHSVTVIVYLDRADDSSGCTELIPGTHFRWSLPPEHNMPDDDSEAIISIAAEPGDILLFHGALWHRGTPTRTQKRRILNLQFAPSWSKRSLFEGEHPNPAWRIIEMRARSERRIDELELLGLGKYM